jgi:hypothetical protein
MPNRHLVFFFAALVPGDGTIKHFLMAMGKK